ncbi:hypothetical protein OV207_23070 [Corallococcus sp. BB11-1]|uniref:hypothetical protein n=1 Tax=Corallococcus sp. BB11-1 TaxID=2996783 RepID=UPI00226DFE86|nr:hypothetical protein [Corallococcus sp. BB11-1]MCY1034353.1 hypothetical protein [Corallococcus sp. BB11-1]
MKKSMLWVALAMSMFGSTALAEEAAACRGTAPEAKASAQREASKQTAPDYSQVQEAPTAEYCVPSNCSTSADCKKGWTCNQKCCVPK